MTWNPYGTGGDDPSTPPGEGLSGSQVPPSSWSAQQGSGYGGYGQSSYGQNAYGQSSPGQSSYGPAGAAPRGSSPPDAAGAHYLSGSPGSTSTSTKSVQKPGLRALAGLLFIGSLV